MLWTDKAKKYLKKYWNIDELKPKQIEVINEILHGNDVIGLLPTGYGKSMCYFIPPLVCRKVMIIISPLIALMDDQKIALLEKGIACSALHCNNKHKDEEINDIIDGKIKIVYMSPEYLVKGNGKELVGILIDNDKLGFVAVDEAHCISSWSHDFRPEYKYIGEFRKLYPNNNIPMIALTATATDYVCGDIKTSLGLNNPKVIKASFDRPNLYIKACEMPTTIAIVRKKTVMKAVNKVDLIQHYIDKYKDQRIIIYINSRKDTDELANDINVNNTCRAYHAGLSSKIRDEIHNQFASGKINIIISTIAFGMGIDMIIKCVIIFGCNSSIEEYVQQCGRAGRDGLPAETILYFDKSQYMVKKHMIKKTVSSPELYKTKIENLSKVWEYIYTITCKRKQVLEYFNEATNYITCNSCDNCCEQKLIDMTHKFSEIIFKTNNISTAFTEIREKYLISDIKNLMNILWRWKIYITNNKLDVNNLSVKYRLRFPISCIKNNTMSETIDEKLDKYTKLYL